jgi:hypothetical protein
MGKYTPLKEFLLEQGKERVPMTFAEIEKVLDASLPASKRYPAWWSNNEFNNTMTSEWIAAGYQTESVDVEGEKLVFRKVVKQASPKGGNDGRKHAGETQVRLPFFGFMKGKMTIEPGYDITKPIDVAWGEPFLGIEQPK